jgi:hypothetical protein
VVSLDHLRGAQYRRDVLASRNERCIRAALGPAVFTEGTSLASTPRRLASRRRWPCGFTAVGGAGSGAGRSRSCASCAPAGACRGRGSDRVDRPPGASAPGCRRTVEGPGVPGRRVTDTGGPAHLGAGQGRSPGPALWAFARSTHRELGDSPLDAAPLRLLFDAFGDVGLLAGYLDSLLADAVAGDRDRRCYAASVRPRAGDRYRLALVQPRRDRGSGGSRDPAPH